VNQVNPNIFTCAGCGGRGEGECTGGLYVIPGTKRCIPYLLCAQCSDAMLIDPQAMSDRVEARLMRPQGAA
jgi:hypothetical protein